MKEETSQRFPFALPHGCTVRSKTTGLIFVLGLAKRATWTSTSLANEYERRHLPRKTGYGTTGMSPFAQRSRVNPCFISGQTRS
jgi:hypothetical protein